jgi:hypothetical protein
MLKRFKKKDFRMMQIYLSKKFLKKYAGTDNFLGALIVYLSDHEKLYSIFGNSMENPQ